jgi:hypothetical protein
VAGKKRVPSPATGKTALFSLSFCIDFRYEKTKFRVVGTAPE